MDEKVKVSLQIEIPRLNEDVDIDSVREGLNEYVKSIISRIRLLQKALVVMGKELASKNKER